MSTEPSRTRWYDRIARPIALLAIGYGAAQVLPPLLSDPGPEQAIQSAAPASLEAASSSAPPQPRLASLPDLSERRTTGEANIPDIAEAVLPSVVNIVRSSGGVFGGVVQGGGSGVIVRADGVVLTNHHVVEGAADVRVRLSDGRELSAKVVGSDPKSDLAVVKLMGDRVELPTVHFGDSEDLRIGETVLAVGSPFGLSGTVTKGIVSALGRSNFAITDYEDFIQTDAAINPGNSGGALVNGRGELIGINTAILSRTGASNGVGLAIPTSLALPIMESLLATGKVERGWLGVLITDADSSAGGGSALPPGTRGVLVREVVPGGPAAASGLESGDIILAVDGKPVETSSRLRNTVAHQQSGQTVRLDLLRAGEREQLSVTLGELPAEPERAPFWER